MYVRTYISYSCSVSMNIYIYIGGTVWFPIICLTTTVYIYFRINFMRSVQQHISPLLR